MIVKQKRAIVEVMIREHMSGTNQSVRGALYGATCFLAVLLTMGLTGCGGNGSQSDDQQSSRGRFSGRFTDGFETSAFRPCGSNDPYWVIDDTQSLIDSTRPNGAEGSPTQPSTVYVEVEGTLSPRGSYGHLETYDRELVVSRVLSVSATPPDSCR